MKDETEEMVSTHEGRCCFCGSDLIRYQKADIIGQHVVYGIDCEECGAKGEETYEMSHIETCMRREEAVTV